ncbi:hypothetical protein GUITHDRAFT_142540 [Guillardia theta CCMP2712]|uniref:Uncharacterized protein n=1 Tax=Guillardia theta (strain CCMP2712) TaxID=905079 RepID=L1IWN9_GUITC|nr:hypothetical protein GUITHDRAFT_142540 [Guillardia theta CCMP2712]EKX40661.1 hypothetical protein GUITHDRAFT_142540 [Guillardia theta CCMP2712]|eukprot:XP_005827641.1 hypothetical protein GUITHDRAFT_142540 [Guillardia theta CCMP2712]
MPGMFLVLLLLPRILGLSLALTRRPVEQADAGPAGEVAYSNGELVVGSDEDLVVVFVDVGQGARRGCPEGRAALGDGSVHGAEEHIPPWVSPAGLTNQHHAFSIETRRKTCPHAFAKLKALLPSSSTGRNLLVVSTFHVRLGPLLCIVRSAVLVAIVFAWNLFHAASSLPTCHGKKTICGDRLVMTAVALKASWENLPSFLVDLQ